MSTVSLPRPVAAAARPGVSSSVRSPRSLGAGRVVPGLAAGNPRSRGCPRHVVRAHEVKESFQEETQGLLDDFWFARGVKSDEQRSRLVDMGLRAFEDNEEEIESAEGYRHLSETLPGMEAAWLLEAQESDPEALAAMVGETSRRLVQLRRILGGEGVDVVWMVLREPALLTASAAAVARRLVQMNVDMAGQGVDIVALVEDQPGLLLQDQASLSDTGESAAVRLEAWRHGLVSDGEGEWERRLGELKGYRDRHGDCSVGCRRGDPGELARWAKLLRKQRRDGALPAEKQEALAAVGFLWDEDGAEWEAMYSELLVYYARNGDVEIKPWGSDENSSLRHWASIQRVSKRNGVLPPDRLERLEALNFNFSGVDGIHA